MQTSTSTPSALTVAIHIRAAAHSITGNSDDADAIRHELHALAYRSGDNQERTSVINREMMDREMRGCRSQQTSSTWTVGNAPRRVRHIGKKRC